MGNTGGRRKSMYNTKVRKKQKIDWNKRKTLWRIMDVQGVFLRLIITESQRTLRWEAAGLTEKERVYIQKMMTDLDDVAERYTQLFTHLHKSINNHGRV